MLVSTAQQPDTRFQCLALGCFLVHTWIAVTLLVCFQFCVCVLNISPMGGLQSLCYKENTPLCCWVKKAWDSVRDFLSETLVLDDPNEIWSHCACVREQKDEGVLSSLHHFLMDTFPPSSRHISVVTVMTSGFLLFFWRAVGCHSRTGSCQQASHCSSYRPPHTHGLYYPLSHFKW